MQLQLSVSYHIRQCNINQSSVYKEAQYFCKLLRALIYFTECLVCKLKHQCRDVLTDRFRFLPTELYYLLSYPAEFMSQILSYWQCAIVYSASNFMFTGVIAVQNDYFKFRHGDICSLCVSSGVIPLVQEI